MTCDNKLMRETEPGKKILKWYLHFTRRRGHENILRTCKSCHDFFSNKYFSKHKCTGKIRQTNARYNNQLVRRSQESEFRIFDQGFEMYNIIYRSIY